MELTDYISPNTLRKAGYIYKDNIDEMLNCIGADALAERGLVNVSQLSRVRLSPHKAAEVIGIHQATLTNYIALHAIHTDNHGRISLLDAITFDKKAAKKSILSNKTHIKNK